MQKRGTVGGGGQRDMPPARMQYFSKSSRDFVLRAARKPVVVARMEGISGSWGVEWCLIVLGVAVVAVAVVVVVVVVVGGEGGAVVSFEAQHILQLSTIEQEDR